jgi:cell wall assembly regulator SMI1
LVAKGYTELCRGRKAPPAAAKDSLRAAWGRLEAWFCRHAPARCEYPLATAASEEDLRWVERLIGQRLPGDFRSSYQRHDGSNRVQIFGIFGLGYWMPLLTPKRLKGLYNSVAAEWQVMTGLLREGSFDDIGSNDRPKGPIKREHWNAGWVPFTCSDTGDFLCIDLDPPPDGKKGQVIFWWHEWGPYTVVADSFGSLLTQLAHRLEDGVYTFAGEPGMGERLGYGSAGQYSFDHLLKIFRASIPEQGTPADRGR